MCEAQRVLKTCISTTTDKGVLEDRMLQLEVSRDKMAVGSHKEIHHNVLEIWLLVDFTGRLSMLRDHSFRF